MSSNGKEFVQRLLAILVIMAMLNVMGIPLTVIFFFAVVILLVYRAVRHSEQQDIRGIFDFYIEANEILRDEERRWYGFEIANVIHQGERVLHSMTDAPPLVYFALGALHHRAGEHEAAVEHLSYVLENEQGDEAHRFTHSPELQRYVQVLRRIEREPAEAPRTVSAMKSLDRTRRARAAALLAESRQQVSQSSAPASVREPGGSVNTLKGNRTPTLAPPPSAPAPISEVLRDIYEEEKRTA